MRIRKRLQNPSPSPDLRSPLPSSGPAVGAAAAPPVAAERGAAAGGVEEGGAMVAAAALRSGGDGCGGGGGKGGFHSNGLAAGTTPCLQLPFPPLSGAAAAEGEEGGVPPKPALRYSQAETDAPLDYGHDKEVAVPKRETEKWKEIGDDLSRHGANYIASRSCGHLSHSLGAEPSEAASSGPGHMAPLTAERAVPRWRKQEEGEFPLMKRRSAGHHARGRSSGSVEEEVEEDVVVAERDVEPTPGMTRRRRAAAFGTKSTMAATGTGAGASKLRCDDTLATVEGADVMPAVAAASMVEGNAGVGNVKKRRSPAVLMEGSRCSRVNGRGWRCCQQTLVGYSLCEHHLGKGRLRSVTSVRSNGRREEEDVSDQVPGKKRRRNNVGMVKARSLSSLLHLPDHHHQYPSPTVLLAIAAPVVPEPIPSPSPTPATAAAPPPRATDAVVIT